MNNEVSRPLALIILDGWGVSSETQGNAIALASTPYYDEICAKYPSTRLAAAGEHVGLGRDAAGNAEVGHMSIGAGRVVLADGSRISTAIRKGEFFENYVLKSAFQKAAAAQKPVHLIGLLSDGEVHSSPDTLFALLRMAKKEGVGEVFVHCILDGRDVPPRTADIYVEALEIKMADIGIGVVATLCGRYMAMDSTENWERTARVFTMLVHAEGERASDAGTAIRNSFLRGISDEFIAPIVLEKADGVPVATVNEGDTVIFFNHRADTTRQLARSLAVPDHGTASSKPKIESVCMTEYDRSFNLPVAFMADREGTTLSRTFTAKRVPNFRIAETDRIAHVTSFFNGGADSPTQFEQPVHVPGPSSLARETEPEMRSFKVTDAVLRSFETNTNAVFVVNLSAPDVVAETGSLEKTIEAVEYVDTCLGGVLEKLREANGVAIITSSHGNCERMLDLATGEPHRFTTSNDVPFHIVDDNAPQMPLRDGGSLQDVAPTILGILGLDKPSEMTGTDLRSR
jgi:2,3-bisphosphoglycerate-independent phosphoglycerate mutase